LLFLKLIEPEENIVTFKAEIVMFRKLGKHYSYSLQIFAVNKQPKRNIDFVRKEMKN